MVKTFRFYAVIIALLVVSGCGGLGIDQTISNIVPSTHSVTFSTGTKLTVPSSFCAQPEMTQDKGSRSFAVFTPCNGSGHRLLTVSVMPLAPTEFQRRFDLEKSIANGSKVLEKTTIQGVHLARLSDSRVEKNQGVANEFWRALALRGEKLVLANYYGLDTTDIDPAKASSILVAVVQSVYVPKMVAQTDARNNPAMTKSIRPPVRP